MEEVVKRSKLLVAKYVSTRDIIWASQMVKNLLAMKETWVRSLGWEDPQEEGMELTPVFLPEESHRQSSLLGCSPWVAKELNMI